MKLFQKEAGQRYCSQCARIHWHWRYATGQRYHVIRILLSILSLGIAWPSSKRFHLFLTAWRCKYCSSTGGRKGSTPHTLPENPTLIADIIHEDPAPIYRFANQNPQDSCSIPEFVASEEEKP